MIHVISRLSTQPLRERDLSAIQVGRLLSVQFVVSGHCVMASGRLRVHLEVADGRTGRVLATCASEDQEVAALHADSHLVMELVAGLTTAVLRHEMRVARHRAAAQSG